MSKLDKMRTPELASACAVIKAACSKVLSTPTTFGMTFNSATKGRFAVVYESEVSVTQAQIDEVERVCNQLIAEDLPIVVTAMDRKTAEEKYSELIYDFLKPPAELQELNILEISGWVINAVKGGEFLPSTGKLSGVTINSINFRPQKKHVEFVFTLTAPNKPVPKKGNQKKAVVAKEPELVVSQDPAEQLTNFVMNQLSNVDLNTEAGKKRFRELVLQESEILFNYVRNASYSEGLKSKK